MKSAGLGDRWISLRVESAAGRPGRAVLLIGVSKRVVPLATRRNRIKRLIREAVRKKIRMQPGKVYRLRVEKFPGDIAYGQVESALTGLFH